MLSFLKKNLTVYFVLILITVSCSKLLDVNDISEPKPLSAVISDKVSTPTFNPISDYEFLNNVNVTISCETSGSVIYYTTNGDTPSNTVGTLYTGPITLNDNTTIKAIAYKDGVTASDIATANYTKAVNTANPSFTPADNTIFSGSQLITISTATAEAEIRYTIDGSDPSSSVGTIYAGPFYVNDTTTIKAIAYKTGKYDSGISNITVKLRVLDPAFNPSSGTFFDATQEIIISTATLGAAIRYTTDGTDPSDSIGNEYTAPFTISNTTTIKAIAYKAGRENSGIVSATFTKKEFCAIPTFSPPSGSSSTVPFTITIQTATSGASLKYTTDGSDPKISSSAVTISSNSYTMPYMAKNIRAYAFKTDAIESSISTATYTINITPVISIIRTGQTISYRAGDDGAYQKGVAWPVPRFTNNGDGTITDNLTGLMWVRVPHADVNNTTTKNWADALSYCNNLDFAGHTDWRLPNRTEIESLVNITTTNQGSWLNTQGFSGIQTSGSYWSSTSEGANSASTLFLSHGGIIENAKTTLQYVIAVRGTSVNLSRTGQTVSYAAGDDGDLQQGAVIPNPRFTDNGDGTLTDNLTGLMWVKKPLVAGNNTLKNWADAIDYANNLNFAGYTDWRLPNRRELDSLVNFLGGASYAEYLNNNGFEGILVHYYWSSSFSVYTVYQYRDNAWFSSFQTINPQIFIKALIESCYVLVVRGGS